MVTTLVVEAKHPQVHQNNRRKHTQGAGSLRRDGLARKSPRALKHGGGAQVGRTQKKMVKLSAARRLMGWFKPRGHLLLLGLGGSCGGWCSLSVRRPRVGPKLDPGPGLVPGLELATAGPGGGGRVCVTVTVIDRRHCAAAGRLSGGCRAPCVTVVNHAWPAQQPGSQPVVVTVYRCHGVISPVLRVEGWCSGDLNLGLGLTCSLKPGARGLVLPVCLCAPRALENRTRTRTLTVTPESDWSMSESRAMTATPGLAVWCRSLSASVRRPRLGPKLDPGPGPLVPGLELAAAGPSRGGLRDSHGHPSRPAGRAP